MLRFGRAALRCRVCCAYSFFAAGPDIRNLLQTIAQIMRKLLFERQMTERKV